jgi:hypothetical protein
MPTLESRQSGEWRETATRIRSDEYTIYYHGTAQRDPASKGRRWTGTIVGDIFVTNSKGHMLIPNGRVTIAPNNRTTVTGACRTIIPEGQ